MTFNELINGLESGKIIVNFQGHQLFTPKTTFWGEYEQYNLLKILKNNTHRTNCWLTSNGCVYMCTIDKYNVLVPTNIEIGNCIYINPILKHTPFDICGACGEQMVPYLYSDSEIRFVPADLVDDRVDEKCHPKADFNHGLNCSMADIAKNDYFETTIDVKDCLLFCNYFNWDELDPQDDFYDINYLKGRYDYMMALAKKGIFYGQTDDCSGHIYINNDKTSVIVVKSCKESQEDTYKFRNDDYHKIGRICFDVWSYRCVDNAKIEKLSKKHGKNDLAFSESNCCYAEVVPGKYKFMHYESYLGECKDDPNIWTVIKKI